MRTLGIDLSAQPKNTAAWLLTWRNGRAVTERVITNGLTDAALLALMDEADRVAIDAPFGWPEAFVVALAEWHAHSRWPGPERERLRFRETDLTVRRAGQNALSVSSDKISVTAMRCAHLLYEHARRSGQINRLDGFIVEAYPAAALRAWELDCSGYKGKKPAEVARRKRIVADLVRQAQWLDIPNHARELCEASDHQLDALVCALVARAVSCGLTILPKREQLGLARSEGWIHVPQAGSLPRIASPERALAPNSPAPTPESL